MRKTSWNVHKFGGSSVANADCFRKVRNIILNSRSPRSNTAVVLSAMSQVTNQLYDLLQVAFKNDAKDFDSALFALIKKHFLIIDELLPDTLANQVKTSIFIDGEDIDKAVRDFLSNNTASDVRYLEELVSGYGEVWSSKIMSAYLSVESGEACNYIDARKVLHVEDSVDVPEIHWERSKKALKQMIDSKDIKFCVITGYIASADNRAATLKRNGSDFSGSIFGALLEADSITIWTDVDGVLSADPRLVKNAHVLPELSYAEAKELSSYGAKVLHPHTMSPAYENCIPLYIRNTFNPTCPGTLISSKCEFDGPKALTIVENVSCIVFSSPDFQNLFKYSSRLLASLQSAGVQPLMITQCDSQSSLLVAIPTNRLSSAKSCFSNEFKVELSEGKLSPFDFEQGYSILSAVGEGLSEDKSILSKFVNSISKVEARIKACSFGASKINISALIDSTLAIKALTAAHSALFTDEKCVSIALIGFGLVGKESYRQLSKLKSLDNFDGVFKLVAVANSKSMILSKSCLLADKLSQSLDIHVKRKDSNQDDLIQFLKRDKSKFKVIIDCTPGDDLANKYSAFLSEGISIITPNKTANGDFSLEGYDDITASKKTGYSEFFYEATVGAGLPVINTINSLINSGDEILKIEAVLSGTLSYLFNNFDGSENFSDLVKKAKLLGYTEPDPRDDLSGNDVARKAVILGREAQWKISKCDVKVESLIDKAHAKENISLTEFMNLLGVGDEAMNSLLAKAKASGAVLRYIAQISASGEAFVGLRQLSSSHPFSSLCGNENIIAIYTKNYSQTPLVIRGPGAGAEVTAGGVLQDLCKFMKLKGF